MASSKPTVFVREATGLVREVGAWPSFLATFGLVTGGVPIYWAASMYTAPGANWPLAFFIAFLPTLTLAGLFTIVGMSMPRSGGDYVFTSRAVGPVLGFLNYWGIVLAFMLTAGVFMFYAGEYFGYLLAGLGAVYGNAGLTSLGTYVTQPLASASIGILIILVSAVLAMMRPRATWGYFVFWGGIVTLVASAIMLVALAGINQTVFASAYNSFTGNSTAYQGVIQTGGVTPPSNSFLATAAALPLAWFSYTWYNLPLAWSGEMKNVRRSMPIAVLAAIAFIAAYYIVFTVVTTHAFGQPFLDNWSSLNAAGNAPVSGVGGFIPFFAMLVYHNPTLYFIMFLAMWLPDFYAMPPTIVAQTRYLFAWAYDRMLPDRFASVSDRFHTPIIATLMVTACVAIGVLLASYLPAEYSTAVLAIFTFGFIIPAIAGVIFPYMRKQIYDTAFVKKKIGLPLITLLGLGSIIYLVYSTYLAYESGSLPIDSFSMTVYGVIYGMGAVVLVASYLWNRRRGLPLHLVFKEIPPE